MKEEVGDLIHGFVGDAICITTNQEVKKDGEAVMGAGIALGAAMRWKSLPRLLGARIQEDGNHVHRLTFEEGGKIWLPHVGELFPILVQFHIFSLPVKNRWAAPADLALIRRSLRELVEATEGLKRVGLPWPGTGAGTLKKEAVYPIVHSILTDDRFVLFEYEADQKRFQKLASIDGGKK